MRFFPAKFEKIAKFYILMKLLKGIKITKNTYAETKLFIRKIPEILIFEFSNFIWDF